MIRLNLPKESYWIDLPYGVRVKVRPLTTAVYEGARFDSQRRLRTIQHEMTEARSAGAEISGLPDFSDDSALLGFSQFLFVQSLAKTAIEEWEGVLEENGNPAAADAERIDELMRIHSMAEEFLIRYTSAHARLIAEGEFFAAAASGISAEAPATANSAAS
jgi:hypothetical protein